MEEEIKQEINKNNLATKDNKKDNKTDKGKIIKFDFNPIEVHVKKYNLKFPIDGMF